MVNHSGANSVGAKQTHLEGNGRDFFHIQQVDELAKLGVCIDLINENYSI